MKLHISKDIDLPIEAITQTFGILGKRGSGKTTTASVFAEELLKNNLPLVIVDPTGAWWGLRSSKDGKSDGFSITILGGDHGDVPLEETGGKVIADLVAEEAPPLVLDLSTLSKNAMRRFMTDFAEELYKKNRNAISVILDEADMFAPQRIHKGGERLFGAVDEIVRRGRIRGLGVVMVSQRSAAINKDILSQCEVLIAHRANHPRDIEPVLEWMRVHTTSEQIKTVHGSIASLADGEAWVMSPEWLDFFGKVQIRDRKTFNSSATPKAGERRISPRHLAEVDLALLQERMAATIERAKENDPTILKRRIRELEHQLKSRLEPTMPHTTIQKIMEKGREEGREEAEGQMCKLEAQAEQARAIIQEAIDLLQSIDKISPIKIPKAKGRSTQAVAHGAPPPPPPNRTIKTTDLHFDNEIKLRDGARRMLAALVQWAPQGMTEGQMRAHAGLKKSGTYSAYKTDLRRYDFFEERGGLFYATQAGIDWLGHDIPAPNTTQEVLDIWMPKLRLGARRMLQVLIEHKGEFISDAELQEGAGLSNSGTYSAYKTELKTAQLIVIDRGMIAANKETLFL
ncbi:MAG: DUF853 family protein [Deltaproteobacteria bacterium]|nr:DUF853 family protein [Deltaproteobacteria bacterium]